MNVTLRCLLMTAVALSLCLVGSCTPFASWDGPVGLYTQPTAETFRPGQFAVTFAEIRWKEENSAEALENIQYAGSATVTVARRWEVAICGRHDVVKYYTTNDITPLNTLSAMNYSGSVKFIILPHQERRIGLAVGIMDITAATRNFDGLDTQRGRREYLVGTYKWASLGLTNDGHGVGAYAGADWELTPAIHAIAEYITKPTFVMITPQPTNRVNFNLGLRVIPCSVPRLRIDASAVGDGTFDFGFSLSYLFN